jgi:hypothetical protein
MGLVWEPLIIHPLVDIHSMGVHSLVMVLSLGQAVVVFRGVEAVAGSSVAAGDSVVGGGNA